MGSESLFHKNKIRKEADLQRRKATKAPYETIWIICEDSKSVPYYFKECIKYFRLNAANVVIVPSKGSAPISVIEHAIETAKQTEGIDQIACVFDHDNHESFERAINTINNHKPKQKDKSKPKYLIITSIPCFEIWLLLHFRLTTKPFQPTKNKSAAELLISNLQKDIPTYTKNNTIWFNNLISRIDDAIKNAKQLDKQNKNDKFSNPSTKIHLLIEHLMNLKGSN